MVMDRAHPRSRGEHAQNIYNATAVLGSSPLTRGAHGGDHPWPVGRGLIPAHAGSTTKAPDRERGRGAHPRSRGEHSLTQATRPTLRGSSPLTRGARHLSSYRCMLRGLIPAHAGSTCGWRGSEYRSWAHPRSRGEHLSVLPDVEVARGSSPLTRGAPCTEMPVTPVAGLIPAHAGSTVRRRRRSRCPWAHPRSRGEHVVTTCGNGEYMGSSPLTRGARTLHFEEDFMTRLIPAHAGSTARARGRECEHGAHPRSRGEHGCVLPRLVVGGGSSPLTRGAHVRAAGV